MIEMRGEFPAGCPAVEIGFHRARVPAGGYARDPMRRLILIANPAASAFTSSLYRDVVRILTGPFDVTPVWPNGPAEARQAAADAVVEGYDVVAAMGGDGVVHQIAGALLGSNTALGIIPAGTTNVLGRILGLPAKPRAAAEVIATGSASPIEVSRVEVGGPEGSFDDVVLFAAGIGFDAAVVERAERDPLRKIRFGALHYARSTAAVAFGAYRSRLPHLRIEAHGRRAHAATAIIQVHDAWTYFGPIRVGLAPGATAAGMTVLIAERMHALRTLALVGGALARRDLERIPGIQVWQGVERLTIVADPPAWLQSDGELLAQADTVTVAAEARRLQVITNA